MNKQRESVYTLRREVLLGQIHITEEELVDTRAYLMDLAEDVVDALVDRYAGKDVDVEEWDVPALARETSRVFGLEPHELEVLELDAMGTDAIGDAIWGVVKASYGAKETLVGGDMLRRVERDIMLQIVDTEWKEHLRDLDHLKEGIGLRGYGQRDPLVEYKKESFTLFEGMKERIEEKIVNWLFWLKPVLSQGEGPDEAVPLPVPAGPRRPRPSKMVTNNPGAETVPAFAAARTSAASAVSDEPMPSGPGGPQPARTGGDDVIKTVRRDEPKVGRNDPCPCGSGKKYKKCHGAAA
jgi:preprotein translocase subunit SecA